MSAPTIETARDTQPNDNDIDPVTSSLSSIVDDLDGELADSLDQPDRRQIIQGIAAAICAQELARMVVTKVKMDAGARSDVDAERVRSDWQVLCRHYAGAKHSRILGQGVTQLEKLSPEQAEEVIYASRRSIEPDLNWAMEEKEVKIGLTLPVVGKIGIGNLRFNLRGTRVAIQSLRDRFLRLAVQVVLWSAVAAGTVHWTSWTFFDEPYLASTFGSLAKLVQFILLVSTTLVMWALVRVRRDDSATRRSRISRFLRFAAWGIVAAGWCHFLGWLLLGISSEASVLEAPAKLLLPFFLALSGIAAWVSGSVFRGDGNNGE